MTASERLDALVDPGGWLDVDNRDLAILRNALPEIVAVVREGERQVRESHPDDVDLELAASLAALDAKLSDV